MDTYVYIKSIMLFKEKQINYKTNVTQLKVEMEFTVYWNKVIFVIFNNRN